MIPKEVLTKDLLYHCMMSNYIPKNIYILEETGQVEEKKRGGLKNFRF